ncbi:hypothetical protein [Haladaptatus halobius]|nr:hypothetical protein [Haladaptatus halobius]
MASEIIRDEIGFFDERYDFYSGGAYLPSCKSSGTKLVHLGTAPLLCW